MSREHLICKACKSNKLKVDKARKHWCTKCIFYEKTVLKRPGSKPKAPGGINENKNDKVELAAKAFQFVILDTLQKFMATKIDVCAVVIFGGIKYLWIVTPNAGNRKEFFSPFTL